MLYIPYSPFSLVPDEILLKILEFISDNYTAHNFSLSCKYVNTLLNKNGYLKTLYINPHNLNIDCMMNMNYKHYKTLNHISFSYFEDPQYWILGTWCKSIYFMNCRFYKNTLDPLCNTDVEELAIDMQRDDILTINFNKFKKLKKLFVYCYDIILKDIYVCTQLKKCNISINTRHSRSINTNFC